MRALYCQITRPFLYSKKSRNIVKNLAMDSKKSRNGIVKNLAIGPLEASIFNGSAALKRIYNISYYKTIAIQLLLGNDTRARAREADTEREE